MNEIKYIILALIPILVGLSLFVTIKGYFKSMEEFQHNLIQRLEPKTPSIEIIKENVQNKERAEPQIYLPSKDIDRKLSGKGSIFG